MALDGIFCLMCAVSYAADLLITESAVLKEKVNTFQLGIFQLGFTGTIMLIGLFAMELDPKSISAAVKGKLCRNSD